MADPQDEPRSSLSTQRIRTLIAALEDDHDVTRMAARTELAELGVAATAPLATCLLHPRQRTRWEAAKALLSIADPSAAPALVLALDDADADVRWVAGEALVSLGAAALPPLLGTLIRRARSVQFCRGAHHVLHDLARGPHRALLTEVMTALDSSEPEVAAPVAAWNALRALTLE